MSYLDMKLLEIDRYWEKGNRFSLSVWPLVAFPPLSKDHAYKSIWPAQTVLDRLKAKRTHD